jgi:glycine/D-amino acid oxidase-like deaminating enzyme
MNVMTTLRMGRPSWLDDEDARSRGRYPALRGTRVVDVAIVGGGITGAVVAHMFADAGIAVAVLEAGRAGHGSTAASTALLMQEADTQFGELASRYGARATRRIWQLNRAATAAFIRTLRRLRIRCELRMRDAIYDAASPDDLRDLRAEFRQRRRHGIPCAWLDPAALRGVGLVAAGAIRTRGNALMDPYRACRGLLEAATRRGAAIFEQSTVKTIDASGSCVTLETDRAWEGLFAVTPDGLPYIGTHARYPRHLFALGYGGNGMTLSYLAATLLLQIIRGRTTADHRLFAFGR